MLHRPDLQRASDAQDGGVSIGPDIVADLDRNVLPVDADRNLVRELSQDLHGALVVGHIVEAPRLVAVANLKGGRSTTEDLARKLGVRTGLSDLKVSNPATLSWRVEVVADEEELLHRSWGRVAILRAREREEEHARGQQHRLICV